MDAEEAYDAMLAAEREKMGDATTPAKPSQTPSTPAPTPSTPALTPATSATPSAAGVGLGFFCYKYFHLTSTKYLLTGLKTRPWAIISILCSLYISETSTPRF
jgi:hypothetical protein